MQAPFAGSNRQAVAGQGVVVHANRLVAGGAQQLAGVIEHGQALPLAGEVVCGDLALQG